MKHKLLLFLLLLPTWAAWAQAPTWQSVVGSAATVVRGSAANANGDYYVVGTFNGSVAFGSTTLTSAGDEDMFLAKLNGRTNAWVWAVSGGGSGTEDARGVAVNGSSVYVTGSYNGTATISGTALTSAGASDMYVAKFVDNGASVATSRAIGGGGGGADQGFGIAVNNNIIYVTGFMSTNASTPTIGGVALTGAGSQDIFVARYTDASASGLANGGAVSGGGSSLDRGLAIGASSTGIYVTGYFTASASGSATISGTQLTSTGKQDMYLAKYTDTGAGLSNGGAVRGGGTENEQGQALALNGSNIYVGGIFNGGGSSASSATIAGTSLTSTAGLADLFLAKYTDAGAGLTNGFATRDGGGNAEAVNDLAVSGTTLYAVGTFTTATSLAGSSLSSTGDDAYVAKYTDAGTTFTGVGAIDAGNNNGSGGTSAATTIALSGSQALVGGLIAAPATFAPAATTGSVLAVGSGNLSFVALLTPAPPVLISINPTSGTVGTSVTLTGTNLTGATQVTFAGTSSNTVTGLTVNASGSNQTVSVNVPAGAVTGNVTITTPGGTSNGVAFTVATAPTVTTTAASSITTTSAGLGGNVTADGGASVTSRGVVYSNTNMTPTIGGSGVTQDANGSGTGTYSKTISGLAPGTTYYVRAYATNSAGTSYGATQAFTTPTTVVSIVRASASPTNASSVSYTITFATAVSGLSFSNFSLTTSGLSGASLSSLSGSGTTYTVVANTGTGSGTLTLGLANSTNLAPSVGNVPFTGETYTIDKLAPTATISSPAGASGGSTATAPIPFTVTFSESVTGFVAGDVPVTNGAVTTGSFSGSGTTYTFSVTPTTSGSVTVNVPANVAQDATGNGNTAAAPFSLTYAQPLTAAPVTTAPANGSLLGSRTPTYSGTAAAGSIVTVYVDGAALGTTVATGGSFSLTQPTNLAEGSHTVYATAQASGSAVGPNSNTNTFIVDTTAPTVAISSPTAASGSTTSTSPLSFTVTFSESVAGFVASDVTVSNGTLSGFSGSGTTYTFSVTPAAAGTATTVQVAANAAQDAAGNGNSASGTYSLTYVAPVTATTWTGNVSTDWFTAGNWTAGVPTSVLDATIPGSAARYPLVGSGTATTRSLTISSGATLTHTDGTLDVRGNLTNNGTFAPTGGTVVLGSGTGTNLLGSGTIHFWNLTVNASGALLSTSAGATVRRVLTLTGNFATRGNAFTLESNASSTALVVNNGGILSGNATVQRYLAPDLNPGLGYRHFSSPVGTATVASLATSSFSPVVNPSYNTAAIPTQERPFPTVFGYDQSRLTLTNSLSAFDKGWVSPTSLAASLTVGQGYTVNLAAGQTLSVTGPVNNDAISLTLSRNSGATAPDAGWALVGNPYPAPLDYSLVAPADRAGLDAAIYVFESTSQYGGSYRASLNGVGGNANSPNSVLAVGQAFFVRVSAGQTSGTLTFRNSQRLTSYANPTYHRTAETRPLVQLTLQGTGSPLTDAAYVYFEKGATDGFEASYDAAKLPNSTGLNLSTSLSGQQLAIDGRGELGPTQRVIPLAVGVPAVGTYTFTATQLLNLTNVPVYLRDGQLGTLIDLRQQPTYSFSVANASALITNRFELVLAPQQALATVPAALTQQVALYPNPAKTSAFLELPAGLGRQAVVATLLDAVGREVRTLTLPAQGATAHPLSLSGLSTGVYALRLSTSAGVITKRLVVE